jgi:hypothetical protein
MGVPMGSSALGLREILINTKDQLTIWRTIFQAGANGSSKPTDSEF